MKTKEIKGFEQYLITDTGTVINSKTNKVLKPCNNGNGYLYVSLGSKNHRYIHRLVAEAFIPNPDNLPQIDHIDTDKTNNNESNLRWVTKQQNMNNPITLARIQKTPSGSNSRIAKPVIGYSVKDNSVIKFDSIIEASNYVGCKPSSISNCIAKRIKSAKGYRWEFNNN